MSDSPADQDARFVAALRQVGFTEAHELALGLLVPDGAEREALGIFVAHQVAALPPHADIRPFTVWLAEQLGVGLARRGQRDPLPVLIVAEALVLIALALDPKTLPPAGPVPALLAEVGASGRRPAH